MPPPDPDQLDPGALLETLLDHSPDLIYFKDHQSRFVRFSKAVVRFCGLSAPEELTGKTDAELYSREVAERTQREEQEIMRTGIPLLDQRGSQSHRDGRTTWTLTSKIPWRDQANNIIGTFGLSKDITSLKEAEDTLELLNRKLRDASRQAGMAEVAAGVLHNVGNALNSVNVSATLIAEQTRHSKAGNLTKVALMMEEHRANLGDFMTRDPRGKVIPTYLRALAGMLDQERDVMVRELRQMREKIDYIVTILAKQEAYAKPSLINETVSVVELIEEALQMNAASLAHQRIRIVRDFKCKPVISTDKHAVVQILLNLFRNAQNACAGVGGNGGEITVRLSGGDGTISIVIEDNGVGIATEDLTGIFQQGGTSDAVHHFALHSNALAAKELGGSLAAYSDGPRRGARFLLELPCR